MVENEQPHKLPSNPASLKAIPQLRNLEEISRLVWIQILILAFTLESQFAPLLNLYVLGIEREREITGTKALGMNATNPEFMANKQDRYVFIL